MFTYSDVDSFVMFAEIVHSGHYVVAISAYS